MSHADVVKEMIMNEMIIMLHECEAHKKNGQISLENIMNVENIDKEELQTCSYFIP